MELQQTGGFQEFEAVKMLNIDRRKQCFYCHEPIDVGRVYVYEPNENEIRYLCEKHKSSEDKWAGLCT